MKLYLFTIACVFSLHMQAIAQFPKPLNITNALVITDSTITNNDLSLFLLSKGYLIKQKDDFIVATEFKQLTTDNSLSFLCNNSNGKIYIRAYIRQSSYNYGYLTHTLSNTRSLRKEFEYFYNLFNSIKPNLNLEAVML